MTQDKGTSAPQRCSHHLTVKRFKWSNLQLPRRERNVSAGQGLCRTLILLGQYFRPLESGTYIFSFPSSFSSLFLAAASAPFRSARHGCVPRSSHVGV